MSADSLEPNERRRALAGARVRYGRGEPVMTLFLVRPPTVTAGRRPASPSGCRAGRAPHAA
jgi:hypothetical protein